MAITVREDLLERSKHVGDRLAAGLRSLEGDGLVAEARGEGAVWAVALHDGQDPVAMRDAMLDRGVITRAVGADTLTFCPPLVATDDQLDRIIDALAASLG
jgi:adenosylmethionine-8-amino-7-oxononanoate aminotransferase